MSDALPVRLWTYHRHSLTNGPIRSAFRIGKFTLLPDLRRRCYRWTNDKGNAQLLGDLAKRFICCLSTARRNFCHMNLHVSSEGRIPARR